MGDDEKANDNSSNVFSGSFDSDDDFDSDAGDFRGREATTWREEEEGEKGKVKKFHFSKQVGLF